MKYIMSKPIPIKKEEEKSSFFFNWYKKEKEVEKNVEEDEIFEMDDDELPPNVKKEESKNGLDAKLSDSDERDDELSDDEYNESVSEDEEQDEICFGFGKHKGKKVNEVLESEPGYFGWVLNADFPRYTKKILTEIRLKSLNTK